MKLFDAVQYIEKIASAQPSVNTVFEGNVYTLNELKDIKYATFVITQQQHRLEEGFNYYHFILYFVDRLTAAQDNRLLVQSTGVDTLTNVIQNLENDDIEYEGNVTINTFTQRFEAECAGAYADITLIFPSDYCNEDWEADTSKIR